jgi:hypothetical protein
MCADNSLVLCSNDYPSPISTFTLPYPTLPNSTLLYPTHLYPTLPYLPTLPLRVKKTHHNTLHTHPERQRPGIFTLFDDQRISSYFFCAGIFNFRFVAFVEQVSNANENSSFLQVWSKICIRGKSMVRGLRKVQILQELKLSPSTVKLTGCRST